MNAFAQDLHLALRDDKKFAAVFAFDDQLISKRNLFNFEPRRHSRDDGLRQFGKEWDASQRFSGQKGITRGQIDPDSFGFAQFHFGAIDPISPTIDLNPR